MEQRDITPAEHDSNRIIERLLDEKLRAVESAGDADALTYIGPIFDGLETEVKHAIESIENRKPKLLVLLETNGGYIETAERVANIFRHHYAVVDFIVPNFAMSAGTVLVMAGDAIHMDYSSVLGPIDPQVFRTGQGFVPALGYLEQYERLIDKSAEGNLTTAELHFLVTNFDAAQLYRYEQQRDLSIDLLKEWLVKYKFKNWATTETRGLNVTDRLRKQRARTIARQLLNTKRWRSHSRGIPMEVLRRDLNLKIDDFEQDPELGPKVKEYYRLLKDYQLRRTHNFWVLHTDGHYEGW